jgi:hypothetical protein
LEACWRARLCTVVMSGVCWCAGAGAAAGYRGEQVRAAASWFPAVVGPERARGQRGMERDGWALLRASIVARVQGFTIANSEFDFAKSCPPTV